MSGKIALAGDRLYGSTGSYRPKGQNTRLFNSSLPPKLPNTQYEGKNFEDAIQNNSPKYRDESGVLRRVKVVKVAGETYKFAEDSTQASKGIPKLAVNSGTPSRQRAARDLTGEDVNLDISGQKYQNINDKRKQSHHIISVGLHGGALEGRSKESKAYILRELANDGFYTGDDRRNYVALYGNRVTDASGQSITVGKAIDEHQAGVHSRDTITNVVANELLPSREQFHQMSDDDVIMALKLSGAAARADIQDVKGIRGKARERSERYLRQQLAKSIASNWASPKENALLRADQTAQNVLTKTPVFH